MAYETIFKSRDDLANSFRDDKTGGALLDLVGQIGESVEWFEMLVSMMNSARARVIAAASYAELHGYLLENA
ncbi:hypothetical protein B5V01_07845 [Mesorhizobium erdmanii]|uniref:Uncharacterized protein n=1 Tax=Mesorhizobium erdmanii TaxID=1777866 RepID=A0A4Q1V945_9HYPH|nr:hypothetical protein B5V01_07845 [Mesorhizobium erdmanii]